MMFEVARTAVGAEVESLAGIQCRMPSFPLRDCRVGDRKLCTALSN